jgi:hypothetical protein
MIQNLLLYCENGCLLDVCGKEAAIMDEEFTYFMGVRIDGEVPSDMECMTITHSTWAVIPNIVEAWKRLYILNGFLLLVMSLLTYHVSNAITHPSINPNMSFGFQLSLNS